VNPNSCSGLTGKNWDSLYNQIKEIVGENPEVVFSQKCGDGTTLTRNFIRKKFNKIVAGGDGTINEVANGFFEELLLGSNSGNDQSTPASPILKPINPEAVIALVPCGTRNVLAKSLDLPKGIVECCQRFVNGKPQDRCHCSGNSNSSICINTFK
jgi:diacylglycerol kinase family enzyme